MHLRIEPLHTPYQTPIAHRFPRRVEPVHQAHRIDHPTDRRADTIPFADYLLRSSLTYPAKPFWADRAHADPRPDTQPAQSTPTRARPNIPRLGDVSPVEQQRILHTYYVAHRIPPTTNLGSITDIFG